MLANNQLDAHRLASGAIVQQRQIIPAKWSEVITQVRRRNVNISIFMTKSR